MKRRIPPVDVYKKPPTAVDEYLPEDATSGREGSRRVEEARQGPIGGGAEAAPRPATPIKPASELLDNDFRVRDEDQEPARRGVRSTSAASDDTEQISIWLGPTERRLLAIERMKRIQVPKSQRPSKEKLTTSALVREAVRRCFGDGGDR